MSIVKDKELLQEKCKTQGILNMRMLYIKRIAYGLTGLVLPDALIDADAV